MQLALLAYELFGGGDIGDLDAARSFMPVRQLGEAGNAILRSGLERSPCFKNAAELSRKLESAIRSEAKKRRTRQTRTRRNPIAFHRVIFYGTLNWFSSLRLTRVVCLALFFAALIPESDSDPGNNPLEKSNANSCFVLNANVAPPVRIAPAPDLRIGPVSPLAVALATPSRIAPVLPINLEYSNPAVIIRSGTKANAEKPSGSEQIPKYRRNVKSATAARIHHEKYRSSGWSTFLDVQKRLIGYGTRACARLRVRSATVTDIIGERMTSEKAARHFPGKSVAIGPDFTLA
jgi:hypothetical protein